MTCGLYKWSLSLGLGAAAGLAMAAEIPEIGFQVLGSCPTGSMRSDFGTNTGYGLGVFGGWEASPGKVVRLAYDGLWYADSKQSSTAAGVPASALSSEGDRKARSHMVSLQYLWYPSGDNEGFYYKVGVGGMNCLTRVRATATFQGGQKSTVDVLDESGTKLAALAGVGYDIGRNWGVMAQVLLHHRSQPHLGRGADRHQLPVLGSRNRPNTNWEVVSG